MSTDRLPGKFRIECAGMLAYKEKTMDELYKGVSQTVKDSLKRYVEMGIPTGGFLQAVLENDLMEAFGHADLYNRANLFDICAYVYNEIPLACHGSVEKVKTWLAQGGAHHGI